MTAKAITVLTLIAAIGSAPALANSWQCANGGVTRTVEVVYGEPGESVPCEVLYDKTAEGAGKSSLWRASNEVGYCEDQATVFLDKLRSLGWRCDAAAITPAESQEMATPAESEEMPTAPDMQETAATVEQGSEAVTE